jgi:agmatinase
MKSRRHTSKLTRSVRSAQKRVTKLRRSLKKSMKKSGSKSKRTRSLRKSLKKAAILHFDAHTDLLDKRLGIDLCFGTWTHQILKELESSDHIIQVGIRSSSKTKRYWKKTLGVEQIWASEVLKLGAMKTFQKICRHYKKMGIEEIYISFDIDALDEKYAAATGTPEKNGLIPTDCVAIIQMLSKEFKVTGSDIMEVAPFVIPEGVNQRDQQSSISVAGDIARTLLQVLSP